jgi:hypothetical protein
MHTTTASDRSITLYDVVEVRPVDVVATSGAEQAIDPTETRRANNGGATLDRFTTGGWKESAASRNLTVVPLRHRYSLPARDSCPLAALSSDDGLETAVGVGLDVVVLTLDLITCAPLHRQIREVLYT